VIPFFSSSKITGLRSSPAGLLIFGENETFLARSDPALNDFAIQPVSGVIGCDDGVTPVRLGGVVFTIYKGEIYAISLGMGDVDFGSGITKLSTPVFEPDDKFVSIAAEAEYRQLVAETSDSDFYRYDAETEQWLTDVYKSTDVVTNIFSNPDANGVRYYKSSDNSLNGAYGTLDTPVVQWGDVDAGDASVNKLWRRVRIFTNDTYSGTPELTTVIGGNVDTITGSELETGNWVFTIPAGLVDDKIGMTLTMNGAVEGDTIEPPVTIEFVERYRRN